MCGVGVVDEFDRGESMMIIFVQVIDMIVEWIDDNLNQLLCIDDIVCYVGYFKWYLQCFFMQYKGESLGCYVCEWKLKLVVCDLFDIDQKVYDICFKYGFDLQ